MLCAIGCIWQVQIGHVHCPSGVRYMSPKVPLLLGNLAAENYQGQVKCPLLSSASQARCSTNDSAALC